MLPDAPGVLSLSCLHRGKFSAYRGKFSAKRGKSEFFLARFCVFSVKSETEKGKNEILFYFWGFRGAAFILFCGGGGGVHWVQVCRLFGVPTGAGGRGFEASGPAGGWLWSSGRVFPYFVRFTALLSVHCLQIWLYFAFLGRF